MPFAADHRPKKQTDRARMLRKQATPAEQKIWRLLREAGIENIRRQHPIEPYIADFCHIKGRLVIELDGASHEAKQAADRKRDAYMQAKGFTVLRFTEAEALRNPECLVATVAHELERLLLAESTPHLTSPQGGRN